MLKYLLNLPLCMDTMYSRFKLIHILANGDDDKSKNTLLGQATCFTQWRKSNYI